jgi:hypothetical protein
MKRFVEGSDRGQSTLFPECVADWIGEENPVRVIDAADQRPARCNGFNARSEQKHFASDDTGDIASGTKL